MEPDEQTPGTYREESREFPSWAPIAGMIFGGLTILFFMALIIASTFGKIVPSSSKLFVLAVLALGVAMTLAFIGGEAAAKGKLPIPYLNHNPVEFSVAGGIAVFVIIFLLGNAVYPEVSPPVTPEQSSIEIPGETGWIFAGYFDVERETFIEGPYVSVINTTRRGLRRFIEVGDIIQLNVSRKVIIPEYKINGTEKKLSSPIEVGVIGEEDETGIVFPSGTKLLVRDVSEGMWSDRQNAALWLRVVDVPR